MTLTAPGVEASSAELSVLEVDTVQDEDTGAQADVADFITKSLRCDADSTKQFQNDVIFSSDITADTITFAEATATPVSATQRVQPHKMFDVTSAQTLTEDIKFKNLHLTATSDFLGGINGIDLETIVTVNGADLSVTGEKTFSQGLTVTNELSLPGTVNGADAAALFNRNYLYKEDPADPTNQDFQQTVSSKLFQFNTVKVLQELSVEKMGETTEFGVSEADLADIVLTNADNGKITGTTTFNRDVAVDNIVAGNVNSDPADTLLVFDTEQTFDVSLSMNSLIVKNNFQAASLNGVNLDTDVGMVDEANNFQAPVTFNTLAVSTAIDMATGKTINGIDVKSKPGVQKYIGDVTVSNELFIDQDNVNVHKMSFGSFVDQVMDKTAFDDEFLFADTAQTLPNLASVGAETVVRFSDLSLRATLNSLDLAADVMHTAAGEESSSADVVFAGGETTFVTGFSITAGDSIGPYSLAELHGQTYCQHDHEVVFNGVKTLAAGARVVAHSDVSVLNSLNINGRDFIDPVTGAFNPARKSQSNTFTAPLTFDDLTVTSDLVVSGDVTSSNPSVELNGRNVEAFYNSAVKTSGAHSVTSAVTLTAAMAPGKAAVMTPGAATWDGEDIYTLLDTHVLLDEDHAVNVHLRAPNMNFKSGLTINPSVGEESTYFYERDLAAYVDTLFTFTDTSLSGSKTITGDVTVGGNLNFAENIFPFGVDIATLSTTALLKSAEQTISVPYTIGNIAAVNKITADRIDGVLLSDLCLVDEDCTITCAEGVSPCVHFKQDLTVSGQVSFNIGN